MAFIVEDGTGLSDSNAYITVDFFKEYHTDRRNNYTGKTDAEIQSGIIKATDYIDRRFGGSFVGCRQLNTQSLEWPRSGADYPDGRRALLVPKEVQQATAEYSLRALSGELAPDPQYDVTNASVVMRDEQVGPIRERYMFGNGGSTTAFRKYPLADALLKPLTAQPGYLKRV